MGLFVLINMVGRIGSGWTDPTQSDPPGSGPDPTRPAINVNIYDPIQAGPARPAGRPDPWTTLDGAQNDREGAE